VKSPRICGKRHRSYGQATGHVGWDVILDGRSIYANPCAKTRDLVSSELHTHYQYHEAQVWKLIERWIRENNLPLFRQMNLFSLKGIAICLILETALACSGLIYDYFQLFSCFSYINLEYTYRFFADVRFVYSSANLLSILCLIQFRGSVKRFLVLSSSEEYGVILLEEDVKDQLPNIEVILYWGCIEFFYKLFISNKNYIRFYKLICCVSIWHEEAYPKIRPH
jgi:hypothetical protein